MTTGVRVRRRPTEGEAIRWTGDNFDDVERFLAPQHANVARIERASDTDAPKDPWGALRFGVVKSQSIATIAPGDWIMREPDGAGFYPCAADVFDATYEVVS